MHGVAWRRAIRLIPVFLIVTPILILLPGKVLIYAVVTDSMKPQINPGDLVVVAPSPVYKVGDIIAAQVGGKIFLHRIVDVDWEAGVYFIRGDNAFNIDYVTPERVAGKVLLKVPMLGYAVIYKPVSLALLVVLLVLVYRAEAFSLLRGKTRKERIALLILLVLHAFVTPVSGSGVVLESSYPFPVYMTVNGVEYLVDSRVAVGAHGKVCVSGPLVYYTSDQARLVFEGLVVDGSLVREQCIHAGPGSVVKPLYTLQVLVRITSVPEGVVEAYLWVEQGSQVTYRPPEQVDRGEEVLVLRAVRGALYLDGEVVIAASGPKEITLEYSRYIRVQVGDRVYTAPAGGSIVVELERLEDALRSGVKLVPSKLVYAGRVYNVDGLREIVITVVEPGRIDIIYTKEYLVRIHTPEGVTDKWVKEGDTIILKFSREIQLGPREKLVLSHVIDNNVTLYTSNATITVDRPHYIKAVYDRYYLVRASSVLGERQTWEKMGTHYTVSFPGELDGFLTYYKLEGILVDNVFHAPGPGNSLSVYIDGPKDITAVYIKKVDYVNLTLVSTPIAVVTGAAILYIYDGYLREEASGEAQKRSRSSKEVQDPASRQSQSG